MNCIGVFCKEPAAGKVKTRLIGNGITAEHSARLYGAFLDDTLDLMRAVDSDLRVASYVEPATPAWLNRCPDFQPIPQRGDDFGARMRHFFDDTFARGARRSILIGSDSPTLPPQILRDALAALKTHPLVLGPAFDGGYYLIGLAQPCPEIFEGIPWSTSTVFVDTLHTLKARNKLDRLRVLPAWYDVDEPADLALLHDHLARLQSASLEFFPRRTWSALKKP